MTTYNRMPDLISSSVTVEDEDRGSSKTTYSTSGTIYPFTSAQNHTALGVLVREIAKLVRLQEAKKIIYFAGFCTLSTVMLLYWCHSTSSMALTAFTFLMIFDILSLLTCLLSVWVQLQQPSSAYSFGIECLLFPPVVHTGRLLVGTLFGLIVHLSVLYAVRNRAFNHVMDASSSSWLQEHVTDMSESLCSFVPGLSKLLLPRINPFALIGFACSFALLVTYFLIDTHQYYVADPWAAIAIAFMTFGTMFPMSAYTGKILLQTTPSHILGQLDKVLREASTLDGVLEFRHEHFWTLSFGCLAGCVQVRVRRDADEQLVLAHVYNRLNNLVSRLTIQIFKDDWSRSSTYTSAALSNPSFPGAVGFQTPPRVASPTHDLTYNAHSHMSPPPLPSYRLNPVP